MYRKISKPSFVLVALSLTMLLAVPLAPQTRAQQSDAPLTLEQLEKLALENNPTLRQADAEMRAAEGRRHQAGLLPNPRVGYTGEEMRGGAQRGGLQGFFVEQEIVLGGKLRLNQRVFEQEMRMAASESEEQKLRVLNAVRLGYVQLLTAQESVAILRELARLAAENADTAARLRNVGQADETEVLQAEVEREQASLALEREQARLRSLWTSLAAVTGRPELPLSTLTGRLEDPPAPLDEQETLRALLERSPAASIAAANSERATALLNSARREAVPNLVLRGGLHQNRSLAEATGRPVGLQGFAEAGIQLPIFNRNQGAVAAASAARERAEAESTRVQLVLRERAAGVLQQYRLAQLRVERYRREILPRAQKALELMQARWADMSGSYPRLLEAQRRQLEAQAEYISALGTLHTAVLTLKGYLLVDGLEAPARPGEVDLPIRDTNLPAPRGAGLGQ